MIVLLVTNEGLGTVVGCGSTRQPASDPFVCPSVCPSDWDKRKTLVVKGCLACLYGEGSKTKRRGQDSLNRSYSLLQRFYKNLLSSA